MSSGQPGRVARAATRYRPGKAPVAAAGDTYSSDSEEDEDEKEEIRRKRLKRSRGDGKEVAITDISSGTAALKNSQRRTAGIIIQQANATAAGNKPIVKLDDVRIGVSKAGQKGADSSDEYETDTDEEAVEEPKAKPVFKKPGAAAPSTTTPARKESSSEYETDSEEDESDEEEDTRPAMLKPIFVSKKQREALRPAVGSSVEKEQGVKVNGAASNYPAEEEEEGGNDDEANQEARRLAEERRKQSHLLAAETIKREMAEREHEEGQPDLSDTDGKDPEEEFQAWRIRELSRLKAEREAMQAKEEEREEIERRRAMPEDKRLAEDTKRAEESREAKRKARQEEGKSGGGTFMQKYHHKGSFFADDELLKNRDAMAKTESAVDISSLPKIMQVRDYGKAGRSKWTHLANEDTTRSQQDHRMKGISGVSAPGSAGGRQNSEGKEMTCFACGGPHLRRDCPQQQGHNEGQRRGGGAEARGANSVPVRDRGGSHYSREHHRRSRSRSPVDRRRREQHSSYSTDRRREDRY